MPDPFERTARAIHDTAARRGWAYGHWDRQTDEYRLRCRALANAAINSWEAEGWRRPLYRASVLISRSRHKLHAGFTSASGAIAQAWMRADAERFLKRLRKG